MGNELYNMGAIMSFAFHQPKDLVKFRPGYNDPVDLEKVPAMLRPVR